MTETSWEPEVHLNPDALSDFIPNNIDNQRLQFAAAEFEDSIQRRLKRGNTNNIAVIPFAHDVYRYCFRTHIETSVNTLEDIAKLPLVENWYYRIDKRGDGHQIRFPILLTPILRMEKVYIKSDDRSVISKLRPIEKLRIATATRNCFL